MYNYDYSLKINLKGRNRGSNLQQREPIGDPMVVDNKIGNFISPIIQIILKYRPN